MILSLNDGTGLAHLAGRTLNAAGDGIADDTASINAQLAAAPAGSALRGVPGSTYKISAPIVLRQGGYQTLDMTGCTIVEAANTNKNMLVNYAALNPAATGTGSITTGTATLTTALAASAVVGQTVTVAGATSGGYTALCADVTAVDTTAGTVTLSVAASATVTGAVVKVYTRDTNVTVIGGTWDRGGNTGPGGVGQETHSFLIHFIDGFTLRGQSFRSTAGKYCYHLAGVTRGLVEDARFLSTYSDGVHIVGPAQSITVRNIHGTAGDDLVALTAQDYQQYADFCGDITDVTVENLFPVKSARAAFKVMGGPAGGCYRIRGRGIFGSVLGTGGAVWIGDDTVQAQTVGGRLDDVLIENLSCSVPSNAPLVQLNGRNAGRIRFNGIQFDNSAQTAPLIDMSPGAAVTVPSLTIDNLSILNCGNHGVLNVGANVTLSRLNLSSWDVASTSLWFGVQIRGTVSDLSVRGLSAKLAQYFLYMTDSSTVTCTRASFLDLHLAGVGTGNIIRSAGNTQIIPRVEMANVFMDNIAWIGDMGGTTEFDLSNVTITNPGQGIMNIRATGVITFRGDGNNLAVGAQGVNKAAGGVANSYSLGITCDAGQLTVTANELVTNTNSSRPYGLGPVVCDGTTWKPVGRALASGSATLAGGTVTVSNTNITAGSLIRLTTISPGGTVGHPYVSARTAATGFTITSTSGTDTSVVFWEVVTF